MSYRRLKDTTPQHPGMPQQPGTAACLASEIGSNMHACIAGRQLGSTIALTQTGLQAGSGLRRELELEPGPWLKLNLEFGLESSPRFWEGQAWVR